MKKFIFAVVFALCLSASVANAQEPAPAEPGPGTVEISGNYTLVRNQFNNHATSATLTVPVAQRSGIGGTFVNVPNVGKGYFGRYQYRRNLVDLKVPASAQFNPKYFDAVFFAEGGVFVNDTGKKAAAGRIGGRLDFTPTENGQPGSVTITVFEYSRLRSSLVQGPLTFRNNNLVSAGVVWVINRK